MSESKRTAPELVASYVTLHGAGFTEPARNSFDVRARAAAMAGFHGVGSQLVDVFKAERGGPVAIAKTATAHGVSVLESELLTGWVFADGESWPGQTVDRAVQLARTVGLHHVTAGEFSPAPLDLGRAAENLALIAEPLAEAGTRIAIEPFGWGAIRDYPLALELVRRSGAWNVGVMIDAWHYFNTGAVLSLLDDVETTEIAAVQLNDGPRVFENLQAAARATRLLPGDGELDVRGLVAKLRERGYCGPWAVEVNHPEFRRLSAEQAAREAFAASTAALES